MVEPARKVEPGRILARELEARGLSEKGFAKLISGEQRISMDTATKLEGALGISAEFWLNLEKNFSQIAT